ncbi:MAG: ABC transporter ATP-binding protein [Thermodesulfobacteriota bacterium]
MRWASEGTRMLEDELQGKSYDVRLMLRLARYLRPHFALVLLCLVVLVVDSLLDLAGPYLTKIAIDEHIARKDPSGLLHVAILYLLALALGFVSQYMRVYLLQLTGQRVMLRLRAEVFHHILRMSQSFFDKTPVGRLITRAVQDIEVINELFTQGVIVIFGDLVTLLAITVVLFWMDWRLAIVVLSVTPLVVVATALYRVKARDAYRKVRSHLARLNAFLQENLSGATTVQLFSREEENFRRLDSMNQETRDQYLRSIRYSSLFFPCVELIAAVGLGLIIWYGGGQVIQEEILPGVLVAFIQYTKRFFQPVRDLAEKYNILQGAMAASERVLGLLDTQEGLPDPPTPKRARDREGRVTFHHVWFAYDTGEWVLRDVSLRVMPGESVAIVGATGAGKSSMVGLMQRAYEPQKGTILVEGIDVRQWDKKELRRHVGVVPQDVFLFSGSLMENLRLWDRSVPEERVRQVVRSLELEALILQIPGGYEAEIGERGQNLSLGQRQLLAFARALLYDPAILVLDEATSSVDPTTEAIIQRAMARLIRGRTSLVIAHRLSTIRNADRIVVMQRGLILEEGTHQELMAMDGIYRRLYRMQHLVEVSGRQGAVQ